MRPFRTEIPALPILLVLLLPALGCDRSAETTEEALAEGEPIAEADADGGEVEVFEAGPAAWTCQRYSEVSAEGTATYDATLTAEAEDYVAEAVRASLADSGAETPERDEEYRTRVHEELLVACGGDPTMLLADAAASVFASWELGEPEG